MENRGKEILNALDVGEGHPIQQGRGDAVPHRVGHNTRLAVEFGGHVVFKQAPGIKGQQKLSGQQKR